MTSSRNKLLHTARELFLERGIPSVGINAITDQAGVARMTLYNNFRSKDDLIAAVFESESTVRRDTIESAQAALEGPIERTLALFAVARKLASSSGFRGCAFINLAIEAAAPNSALHALARAHKRWILNNIGAQLALGTFAEPNLLAEQVLVLWDGGIVGAYVHQSEQPIRVAQSAAQSLLRSALQ